jgi:tetratricopeptide (TPR) repeat protein
VANQLAQLQFLVLVESRGVDFLETEFDSLRSKYGVTNPNVLNLLGYNFMNQGRFDDAIIVHKANIRLYPDLANGYDSLSETYEASGNAEGAIKNAKICLEKLPFDSTLTDDFRELVRQSSEDRLKALGADNGKVNI